ncbi:MAG: hypothetical protein ABJA77_16460 [Variovorax sp.]
MGANVKSLVSTMLLLSMTLPCAAESSVGVGGAGARISFSINVPPVFKVLQTTPKAGGHEYLVWVNMKTISINGKDHRFTRVGETTLFLPSSTDAFIVHGL